MQTAEVVLPVFALMAFGWLFARLRLITEAQVGGIVTFVFYLAIPALLFRTLAGGAVQAQIEATIIVAYFAAALTQFAIGWLVSRHVFGNRADESGIAAMGATFSNLVLICIPLVQRAYGDAGLVPLMLIVMVHGTILFSATTLAIEFGRGGGRGDGLGGILRRTAVGLRAVVLNPIVAGALAGLAFGFTGLRLPVMVDDTLALLGRGAAPLSLFAVGATLAGCRLAGDLRESLTMAALKLLLLPSLVWLSATQLFDLRADWVTVSVVAAAMPTGANVYVFARKYDMWVARGTAVVLVSTLAAVVTVTLLIASLPRP